MSLKLNRESLKKIINESVGNFLYESAKDQMNFGINGPIPLEPADSLCDNVNPDVLAMVDSGNKSIRFSVIGSPQYFGDCKVRDAYTKYSQAIVRHDNREAVGFFTFLHKIRMGWYGAPLQVFEKDGSYLIGTMRAGVFLCIYICPKNAGIAMFKFIKEVCEYDNVVFAVTDDMGSMLERLGCPKYDGPVTARYRGHSCEKSVYGTTKKAAEKGAKLVGLMGKSGDLGKNIKNSLMQNPETKDFIENNPNLPFDVINIPEVTKLLMNNPEIIDILNDNPALMQSIIDNPLEGFLKFLLMYRNKKMQQTHINERKNKK
jgi:hypothetical protein